MNTQMNLNETVTVQVTNVAGADVEIVNAALRWASSGGQSDALTMSPPDPTGGAATIPAGGTVGPPSPMTFGSGIEYRDIVAYIDAKTADGRRQRLLRPLTVQRPGFDAHVVPALGEPVALAMWTDTGDVVPMWRGGKETRWINVGGHDREPDGRRPSIIRMDVEVVVDGEWLLEENLSPLRFHQSLWPDERGCQELNGQDGCTFVDAESNGTLELGKKVLSRFVHGFELDVEPGFENGNLRVILHYQRRRRCGTVLRDLPIKWREPVDVSPPVRGGTFHWGTPSTTPASTRTPGPDSGRRSTSRSSTGRRRCIRWQTVSWSKSTSQMRRRTNPNHWITVWHPDLELWTGYYHLKPGTLVPEDSRARRCPPTLRSRKIGNSGTRPRTCTRAGTYSIRPDFVGLLRCDSRLTDDQDNAATQTPATGSYKS